MGILAKEVARQLGMKVAQRGAGTVKGVSKRRLFWVIVVICLSGIRFQALAKTPYGWEFQWEQMRMDVKGFDEHVGDVVHRQFLQTTNPPSILDTFTREPITLNLRTNNGFRTEIKYRRQGWGGGVSGWFFSTEDSVSGRLTSPAAVTTSNSRSWVVNTISMWQETLPPVDNDLEPLRFSPVDYHAHGHLSTFTFDAFVLRTLADSAGIQTELILGAKIGRLQTHQVQGFNQRAFLFNFFGSGRHLNNLVSLNSTADADFLGAGPMIGLDNKIQWRRLSIRASAEEAFVIGNARPRGVITNIDDVTLAQSPSGPFLTCPAALAPAGCFATRSDITFSNPERIFVPVTEFNLQLLVDITRNISVGGSGFAAIWANSPIPPSFTSTHAQEGPGLNWTLEERTLRYGGASVVVNIHF